MDLRSQESQQLLNLIKDWVATDPDENQVKINLFFDQIVHVVMTYDKEKNELTNLKNQFHNLEKQFENSKLKNKQLESQL